jgi:hypothetical protein
MTRRVAISRTPRTGVRLAPLRFRQIAPWLAGDRAVNPGVLLPAGLALIGDRDPQTWSRGARRVLGSESAYGATPSWTVSEPPRVTYGWSRTSATAESMSSARSTE